jgi:hypothetical protein
MVRRDEVIGGGDREALQVFNVQLVLNDII